MEPQGLHLGANVYRNEQASRKQGDQPERTAPRDRPRIVGRSFRPRWFMTTTACLLVSVLTVSLAESVASAVTPAVAIGVFAGYTAPVSSGSQTVSATFVVPTLDCSNVKPKGFQAVVLVCRKLEAP